MVVLAYLGILVIPDESAKRDAKNKNVHGQKSNILDFVAGLHSQKSFKDFGFAFSYKQYRRTRKKAMIGRFDLNPGEKIIPQPKAKISEDTADFFKGILFERSLPSSKTIVQAQKNGQKITKEVSRDQTEPQQVLFTILKKLSEGFEKNRLVQHLRGRRPIKGRIRFDSYVWKHRYLEDGSFTEAHGRIKRPYKAKQPSKESV
ncbi:hypothetical protein BB560_000805 [Smittium megazygosporum]|uniref:Uncharacterized protein n=1 Tax=Smittium megazygosporum TaxID=133381 RepID=A0A2T9ZJ95_9FUNG|nr:hypothetical protein BB560_000805 [Smittium megazygosporum]